MIDMDPSDLSCVYSTLCYISSHAKKYNITLIVTFDQPLWWKALQIRESVSEEGELHSIVLCLGDFHTIMSFLGCIGHIMSGCGLQDVLYASNAVTHILSEKTVERAIRGHFLIDPALSTMKAFDVNLSAINQLEDLINNSSSQENNNLDEQP